jgi:hypothetical protein
MVDCTNGAVSHKNLALAKMNSNWACDPEEMRMLVVGDVGRACLFDLSMGAKEAMLEEKKSVSISDKSKKLKMKMKNKNPPIKGRHDK